MLLSLETIAAILSTLYLALLFIIGCCVGSFINVLIYRLPLLIYQQMDDDTELAAGFSLAWPPSHCPACQRRIKWYDNMPLLSWLLLRGKCRHCHTAISVLYPLSEAVTGLWFVLVYFLQTGASSPLLTFSAAISLLPLLLLFCLLYCISVIDMQHYLIPDVLSLGMLWCGLLFSVTGLTAVSPVQAVTGCALAWLMIWAVSQVYSILRKHEGLGSGDAKLFAAATAWLGLSQLPWLILCSAGCGAVLYALLWRCQARRRPPLSSQLADHSASPGQHSGILSQAVYIPFGPAIALSTLLLFLAGKP